MLSSTSARKPTDERHMQTVAEGEHALSYEPTLDDLDAATQIMKAKYHTAKL